MIFEISHTQHPTTKTMYIFSLIQIKTTTTILGVSITPTTSCGRTELRYLHQLLKELLCRHPLFTDQFFYDGFQVC